MLTLAALSNPVAVSRGFEPGVIEQGSDEALLSAIASGDRRAMQTLYQRHKVRVYRFVLRLVADAAVAEDIVSEVFLEVWRRAEGFKSKSRVSTWLLGIARFKALSALRGRSHERIDDREATAIADPADDAETVADRQGRSAIVAECLSRLSAIHREVLDLVYYHEKSVDEVAAIVGAPASTVKTRMFYARKRMENLLGSAGLGRH
ncbi:MAG: sigma-70 family RNA polymerase sigma factor [Xanthobacteraceae bacterium]